MSEEGVQRLGRTVWEEESGRREEGECLIIEEILEEVSGNSMLQMRSLMPYYIRQRFCDAETAGIRSSGILVEEKR